MTHWSFFLFNPVIVWKRFVKSGMANQCLTNAWTRSCFGVSWKCQSSSDSSWHRLQMITGECHISLFYYDLLIPLKAEWRLNLQKLLPALQETTESAGVFCFCGHSPKWLTHVPIISIVHNRTGSCSCRSHPQATWHQTSFLFILQHTSTWNLLCLHEIKNIQLLSSGTLSWGHPLRSSVNQVLCSRPLCLIQVVFGTLGCNNIFLIWLHGL